MQGWARRSRRFEPYKSPRFACFHNRVFLKKIGFPQQRSLPVQAADVHTKVMAREPLQTARRKKIEKHAHQVSPSFVCLFAVGEETYFFPTERQRVCAR